MPGRFTYLHSGGPGNAKHIYGHQRRLHRRGAGTGIQQNGSIRELSRQFNQVVAENRHEKVEPVHRRVGIGDYANVGLRREPRDCRGVPPVRVLKGSYLGAEE
ncbi:Uncharacterised protein [Mycobacterium tuberculosis]|nr:Uncharacterised protein [Mycobacterium tuberculosis]CNM15446.1 Uncharacterised protein [Mycobacterium tuberculosis]CNM58651.1 Uncharacterised protein [Mycobacterium tuberculosis]CNM92683.1 Uncharacterised protein [Mycobacterium tuberculosis]CNN01541.1 Uncharacterised protein [Mycobacterium tuberculosis]